MFESYQFHFTLFTYLYKLHQISPRKLFQKMNSLLRGLKMFEYIQVHIFDVFHLTNNRNQLLRFEKSINFFISQNSKLSFSFFIVSTQGAFTPQKSVLNTLYHILKKLGLLFINSSKPTRKLVKSTRKIVKPIVFPINLTRKN